MKHTLLGTLLLMTASAGSAQTSQNQPSLTWEGDVDGTVLLIVGGDRVSVDRQSTGSVSRPSFRFRTPLPAMVSRIEVENRLEGARVQILEQPRRNNNFTAVVEIVPRARGVQHVSLDFYWEGAGRGLERGAMRDRNDRFPEQDNRRNDTRGADNRGGGGGARRSNARAGANASGTAHWSGQVDTEVFVLMRGRQFFSTAVRGRNVSDQQIDVTSPLPRRTVNLVLEDVEGRGQIQIMEQPDSSNDFTAKVRIVDPPAGAGSYGFTLTWDEDGTGRSSQQNTEGVLMPSGGNAGYDSGGNGSARWSGQVDGTIRISFRDNQASVQRLSGQTVGNEQVRFGGSVPRRNVDVSVNKLRGRGDVNIVERPSAGNNYTVVVEINDKDGGSDSYDIDVSWR